MFSIVSIVVDMLPASFKFYGAIGDLGEQLEALFPKSESSLLSASAPWLGAALSVCASLGSAWLGLAVDVSIAAFTLTCWTPAS